MSIHQIPIPANTKEQDAISQMQAVLHTNQPLHLATPDGANIDLPPSARLALLHVIESLAQGESVAVLSLDADVTTQEAADILNVSRPYLIKLLEKGAIPFTMIGTHRRLRVRDVLRYREEDRQRKHEAIVEIARISQEAGAYD